MTLALDERRRTMLVEMGLRDFALAPLLREPEPQQERQREPQAAAVAAPPPVVRTPQRPVAPPSVSEPVVVAPPAPGRALTSGALASLDWSALAEAVAGCRACRLCESRRNTVFGVGDQQADWLIVGEAPGEQEDLQGEPFVGQAGKLLDNMLRALGLDRMNQVYIANVLKCRPPGNRNPDPEEVAKCEPFLRRQVELLQPKIILAMGRFAVQSLLGSTEPIGRLRGRVHQYEGVPLVVTYHPAYLLRNLPEKAKAWSDLCLAREQMQRQAGWVSGSSGR